MGHLMRLGVNIHVPNESETSVSWHPGAGATGQAASDALRNAGLFCILVPSLLRGGDTLLWCVAITSCNNSLQ